MKINSDRYYGDKALNYDNKRFGTNAGKMIYQLEKNTFTSLVRSVIVDNSRILEIATGTGRFIENYLKSIIVFRFVQQTYLMK